MLHFLTYPHLLHPKKTNNFIFRHGYGATAFSRFMSEASQDEDPLFRSLIKGYFFFISLMIITAIIVIIITIVFINYA